MPSFISKAMKLRILAGNIPAWMRGHIRSDYIIKCYLSAPLWVHTRDFNALRKEADELTAATGRKHVLDHKIPVTHPGVCGLTVPWNMRVIPDKTNAHKRNEFHPDQMELFLAPRDVQQLALWDEETRQRESGMNSKQRRREEVKRIRNEGYLAAINRKPRGHNPYSEAQDMCQWDIGYQSGLDEIMQDEARRIVPAIAMTDQRESARKIVEAYGLDKGLDAPASDIATDLEETSYPVDRAEGTAPYRGPDLVRLRDAFERYRPGMDAKIEEQRVASIVGDAPSASQDALGSTISVRRLQVPDYTIPGT